MILVTGATGHIGRELVARLDSAGAAMRLFVRDPARAADLPASAERVAGDLADPVALRAACEGIDSLFLLVPGLAVEPARHAVAAARRAGVRHLVLVSSYNVLGDPMPAMGRWHHEREEIVGGSGISATILRPGGFMTNALEWAPDIRAGRPVFDPTGPGRYAPIDPADIAAVAAIALTEPGHDTTYCLTGEQTFTIGEQVEVLARAIGRPIPVHTATTAQEAVRSRYPQGAPPALAAAILEGFTVMRADTVGLRTDTVRRLLGRAPRTFAEWCERHRDQFH